MSRRHSGFSQYEQACRIARESNLFVVDKAGRYLIYRRMPDRNVYIGKCSSTETLFHKSLWYSRQKIFSVPRMYHVFTVCFGGYDVFPRIKA